MRLADYEAKGLKPKMTKAEAIETVMMVMGKGQNDANQFVKCLVALGVLKVEEGEEEKVISIKDLIGNYPVIKLSEVIGVLNNIGYRVDKR